MPTKDQIVQWIKKHKIISVLVALFVVGVIAGPTEPATNAQNPATSATTAQEAPTTATEPSTPDTAPTVAPKATQSMTIAPAPAPKAISTTNNETTISRKNAIKKAVAYLSYSGFSRDGLVAQLEYEQFSHADAVYGADNSGANWNEQAAKKAKSYMEYSAFSRGSLIEQLMHEKFTRAQAEYGANAVGL
jgi:hypothetical protein